MAGFGFGGAAGEERERGVGELSGGGERTEVDGSEIFSLHAKCTCLIFQR